MEIQPNENAPRENKRPVLLTVLCVLTFIGSGLGAFSNLLITTSYEETMALLEETEHNFPLIDMFMKAGYGFFLTGTILYSTSLLGALQMWKLRKIGFHFYFVSQILIIILPLVYIEGYPAPYLDVAITALFVWLYYRHLPLMR
ncbi:MAG: hypothetical protein KKA81_03935 [Bacteroidetes bacterium]|nr:hypothetical protein [Bacteroidota bacterium]